MTGKPLLTRAEVQDRAQQRRAEKAAKAVKRGVKKVSKGARFPHLVNEPLRKYVRGLPCVIAGLTDGNGYAHKCAMMDGRPLIVVAHLKTRGAGGADDENCFPACAWAHFSQEGRTKEFEARWGIKLAAICRRVTARFYREYPRTKASPRNAAVERGSSAGVPQKETA